MTSEKCKMVFMNGKPVPKLCICGGFSILAGNKNVGSFFWDRSHGEFVCSTCGSVLNRYGEYV